MCELGLVLTGLFVSVKQDKEMEKQRLLYQQSRLHERGAAEMVLQMISACKGEQTSIHTHVKSQAQSCVEQVCV